MMHPWDAGSRVEIVMTVRMEEMEKDEKDSERRDTRP